MFKSQSGPFPFVYLPWIGEWNLNPAISSPDSLCAWPWPWLCPCPWPWPPCTCPSDSDGTMLSTSCGRGSGSRTCCGWLAPAAVSWCVRAWGMLLCEDVEEVRDNDSFLESPSLESAEWTEMGGDGGGGVEERLLRPSLLLWLGFNWNTKMVKIV